MSSSVSQKAISPNVRREYSAYKKTKIPDISTIRPGAAKQHLWSAEAMGLDGRDMTEVSVNPRKTEIKISQPG